MSVTKYFKTVYAFSDTHFVSYFVIWCCFIFSLCLLSEAMTEINPDAELRHKIHHMIETMDKGRIYICSPNQRLQSDHRPKVLSPYQTIQMAHHRNPPKAWFSIREDRSQIVARLSLSFCSNYVMSLYLYGTYNPSVTQVSFHNKLTLDCRLVNLMKNTGTAGGNEKSQRKVKHNFSVSKVSESLFGMKRQLGAARLWMEN